MNAQKLVVVTDGHAPQDQTAAETGAVLAHWPGQAPPVAMMRVDDVLADPASLDAAAVVWLMIEDGRASAVYELTGLTQDRHLPTMLTQANANGAADDGGEGIFVCPPTTDPAQTCAALAALWSQAPTLQELATDVRLLREHQGGLAGQISRIDEELRLAAQLQREFLPTQLPQVHDVELRALWRPAGYVSGDIYEASRLDEDHLGLFVADAVGHGVPAALMTMYIKRSLNLKTIDPSLPRGYRLTEPGEALAKLNRDMVQREGGQVRFATACYALVDCRRHVVRFARAGHPYPILLHADGRTEHIEPDGGLLGVFPEETYEQMEIALSPGDRLLLYSDGFEVAFPEAAGGTGRKKVANMRYCDEFEDLRHGPLDAALQRLQHKLDEQAGSLNQRDDLTVMCLAVHPPADAEPAAQPQQKREPVSALS